MSNFRHHLFTAALYFGDVVRVSIDTAHICVSVSTFLFGVLHLPVVLLVYYVSSLPSLPLSRYSIAYVHEGASAQPAAEASITHVLDLFIIYLEYSLQVERTGWR